MSGRPRWGLALVAALLLAASMPPAWVPGGGFLVLPGLGAFYACATGSARPYLLGYGIGAVHLAVVAWSLRFVAGGATVAVVLVGAVYSVAIVGWARVAPARRLAPLWFGAGVAAIAWGRAHMPEVPYPHGQPAHALYLWPALLGPVRWGGEVLANFVCAWSAAAAVDLFRAWRVARPRWSFARVQLGLALGLWVVLGLVAPPRPGAAAAAEVDVAALEPGAALVFERMRGVDLTQERLVRPTLALAGPDADDPPDLVLWPESTAPHRWVASGRSALWLAPGTHLLAGAPVHEAGREFSACALFDARGHLLGWHEKQVPVPAAERLPWLGWLPSFVATWASRIVGYYPRLEPGRWRPPLGLGDGVAVGGLLCFDNAFDEVARRHVAGGANLLAVLSNEAWYHQGGELEQMVAMSVFRALETGTPVVRSTMDGRTVAIDADGRLGERLAAPAPETARRGGAARVLRVKIRTGPGALGPLAWVHRAAPWLAFATGLSILVARRRKSCRIQSIDSSS